MVGNGGNVTAAMEAAGYAPATVHTPSKLTDSEGWKALMETHLPDELLTKQHKTLLTARGVAHESFPFEGECELSDDELRDMYEEAGVRVLRVGKTKHGRRVYYESFDAHAMNRALETAYKIKGKMSPDAAPPPPGTTYNIFNNPQILVQVKSFEDSLKQQLSHGPNQNPSGATDSQS